MKVKFYLTICENQMTETIVCGFLVRVRETLMNIVAQK